MAHPVLYDYQRVATNFMKTVPRCGLFLDMGLGKCLKNSHIIPTPTGNRRVGDIRVGDDLYDRHGKPTKVLAVYPHTDKPALEVTLRSGRSFVACDDHLVPYFDENDQLTHKPLGEMVDDYLIPQPAHLALLRPESRYHLPMNDAVERADSYPTLPPYAFGVWLMRHSGRSSLTLSLARTTQDDDLELKDLFEASAGLATVPTRTGHRYRWTNAMGATNWRHSLRALGLFGKDSRPTYIPDIYLEASVTERRDLLDAIVDSEAEIAYTMVSGLTQSPHYHIQARNEQLASDIQHLAFSLGIYALRDEKDACSVRLYTTKLLGRLGRIAPHQNVLVDVDRDPIVRIERVEPCDMTCFTVDNPEKLFLINDYIVTHNTLIALTGLVELAQEGRLVGHILVIAPKRIAVNTWPDEIEKWEHVRGARYVNFAGITKKKRDALFDAVATSPPTIYIINRELVPQLVDRFPGDQWQFPNVIIDEAQSFKGYSTKGFKALKSIAPFTRRWVELTGTPAPNNLLDIWSLIYLLDGGYRLGKNITTYRDMHFNPGRLTPEGYPYEWLLKDGHDDIIHDKLKDVSISMMKEDHLSMPDLIHNVIELDMTATEKRVYNQLKKDKVLPLANGGTIESANAAVLAGALLQLANGAIYEDDTHSSYISLHDHKTNALRDIFDGSQGQPILVFYWYQHDKERILAAIPEAEVFTGKPEQLKRWNQKQIPMLLAQPASAGHGLNFQHGGHILVFFSVPWSLELYQQSIARLYRNGQTQTVIVHYLRMRGTIENQITDRLFEKQVNQQALIDAVKAHI